MKFAETVRDIIDELHVERLDYESEYLPLANAINQLTAYENTGLEPEEVAQAKKLALQRLCEVLKENGGVINSARALGADPAPIIESNKRLQELISMWSG